MKTDLYQGDVLKFIVSFFFTLLSYTATCVFCLIY